MSNNFNDHLLEVHFKQVFWKSRNMKWSPYMYLKKYLALAAFSNPTKSSPEITLCLQLRNILS